MRPARVSGVAALAAACAGTALWCSLGVLTVTDAGAGGARIGLLPSLWWLAFLVPTAIACAWLSGLSSDRARPLFFSAILLLPWLPFPLPAPALVWAGPVTWFVWAAIAGAMIVAGDRHRNLPARMRDWLTLPRRAPWVAFVLAAIVYVSTAWRLSPFVPGGDEPHYLVIAQSLWRDGDLRIENNHQRGDYLEYFPGTLKPDFLKRGRDGEIYSIHMPGVPALIAPVLAVGGYSLVTGALAIVSALATAVAWRVVFTLAGSAAAAWFGWAAVALTTPFLLLSFTVYPDGAGAVAVMWSVASLVGVARRPKKPTWWWVAAGLLPAVLPWFHPRFAVLAAALGLVFALRTLQLARPWRALIAFGAAPLASAAGWFGYYGLIYGRFDPSIAYGHYTQMSLGRLPIGVLGLLVDQQYGLLACAPVFVLGLAGLVPFARRHRRLALEWVAIVVPYVLVTAMYHMWWGGFSSPARLIGATLLVFAVPIGMAWESGRTVLARLMQTLTLVASGVVTMLIVSAQGGQFAFNQRDQAAPFVVWLGQVSDIAHGLPSLFRGEAGGALVESLVWGGAIWVAWAAAGVARKAGQWHRGSTALVVLVTTAVSVMAALGIVWRRERVTGLAATSGQIRALDALNRERVSTGLLFEPVSATTPGQAMAMARLGLDQAAGMPQGALLWVPHVPAGHYRLWMDSRTRDASIVLRVFVGRTDGPITEWRADTAMRGASSHDLFLPVDVHSITVRGETALRRGEIWLQRVEWPGGQRRVGSRRASAGRRYGDFTVFSLGGEAYLEPDGMWTAGGHTAELVIAAGSDQKAATLAVMAGGVATPIEFTIGEAVQRFDLAAGERRDVSIRISSGEPVLIRVRAERGFRPSAIDPKSRDTRLLGVRIELAADRN